MGISFQRQLNQLKKRKLFFILLILVIVVIMVWIIAEIVTTDQHVIINKEMEAIRKPLEINIDEEVLQALGEKKIFSEEDLNNFTIYRLSSTGKLNYAEFRTTSEIERNLNIDLTFGEFDTTPDTISTDHTGTSEPIPDTISQPIE